MKTSKASRAEKRPAKLPTFAFRLILEGASEITDEIDNGLFEAGCDDTLLSSCEGVLSLVFDRAAPSLTVALTSAIFDVERAGVGPWVARVEPEDPL